MKRISFTLSFTLFIALCASLSFWLLQLMTPEVRHVVAPIQAKPVADVASVAGLFGGAATVSTNYQLKGIVMANPASQSGAILNVDSQPAQAFRLNAEYILLLDQGVGRRIDLPKESKSSGAVENSPPRYSNVPPGTGAGRIPDPIQTRPNLRPLDMQRASSVLDR